MFLNTKLQNIRKFSKYYGPNKDKKTLIIVRSLGLLADWFARFGAWDSTPYNLLGYFMTGRMATANV